MKVTVCFKDVRVVVPCGEGTGRVRELLEEAVSRYRKATRKGGVRVGGVEEGWFSPSQLKLSLSDGGILDLDDVISDVVDDKEQIHAIPVDGGDIFPTDGLRVVRVEGMEARHHTGDGNSRSSSSGGASSPDYYPLSGGSKAPVVLRAISDDDDDDDDSDSSEENSHEIIITSTDLLDKDVRLVVRSVSDLSEADQNLSSAQKLRIKSEEEIIPDMSVVSRREPLGSSLYANRILAAANQRTAAKAATVAGSAATNGNHSSPAGPTAAANVNLSGTGGNVLSSQSTVQGSAKLPLAQQNNAAALQSVSVNRAPSVSSISKTTTSTTTSVSITASSPSGPVAAPRLASTAAVPSAASAAAVTALQRQAAAPNTSSMGRTKEELMVVFPKSTEPLGVHVVPIFDEHSRSLGLFIHMIEENGRAYSDGRLTKHDTIVEINSTPLYDVEFSRAQDIFRSALLAPELEMRVLRGGTLPLPLPSPLSPLTAPPNGPFSSASTNKDTGISGGATQDDHHAGKKLGPAVPARNPRTKLTQSSSVDSSPKLVRSESSDGGRLSVTTLNIDLVKGQHGLGFSITTRDGISPRRRMIYVKKILTKGAASENGRLQPGDILLELNGEPLMSKTQAEVIETFRNTPQGATVSLVVSRQGTRASVTSGDFIKRNSSKSSRPLSTLGFSNITDVKQQQQQQQQLAQQLLLKQQLSQQPLTPGQQQQLYLIQQRQRMSSNLDDSFTSTSDQSVTRISKSVENINAAARGIKAPINQNTDSDSDSEGSIEGEGWGRDRDINQSFRTAVDKSYERASGATVLPAVVAGENSSRFTEMGIDVPSSSTSEGPQGSQGVQGPQGVQGQVEPSTNNRGRKGSGGKGLGWLFRFGKNRKSQEEKDKKKEKKKTKKKNQEQEMYVDDVSSSKIDVRVVTPGAEAARAVTPSAVAVASSVVVEEKKEPLQQQQQPGNQSGNTSIESSNVIGQNSDQSILLNQSNAVIRAVPGRNPSHRELSTSYDSSVFEEQELNQPIRSNQQINLNSISPIKPVQQYDVDSNQPIRASHEVVTNQPIKIIEQNNSNSNQPIRIVEQNNSNSNQPIKINGQPVTDSSRPMREENGVRRGFQKSPVNGRRIDNDYNEVTLDKSYVYQWHKPGESLARSHPDLFTLSRQNKDESFRDVAIQQRQSFKEPPRYRADESADRSPGEERRASVERGLRPVDYMINPSGRGMGGHMGHGVKGRWGQGRGLGYKSENDLSLGFRYDDDDVEPRRDLVSSASPYHDRYYMEKPCQLAVSPRVLEVRNTPVMGVGYGPGGYWGQQASVAGFEIDGSQPMRPQSGRSEPLPGPMRMQQGPDRPNSQPIADRRFQQQQYMQSARVGDGVGSAGVGEGVGYEPRGGGRYEEYARNDVNNDRNQYNYQSGVTGVQSSPRSTRYDVPVPQRTFVRRSSLDEALDKANTATIDSRADSADALGVRYLPDSNLARADIAPQRSILYSEGYRSNAEALRVGEGKYVSEWNVSGATQNYRNDPYSRNLNSQDGYRDENRYDLGNNGRQDLSAQGISNPIYAQPHRNVASSNQNQYRNAPAFSINHNQARNIPVSSLSNQNQVLRDAGNLLPPSESTRELPLQYRNALQQADRGIHRGINTQISSHTSILTEANRPGGSPRQTGISPRGVSGVYSEPVNTVGISQNYPGGFPQKDSYHYGENPQRVNPYSMGIQRQPSPVYSQDGRGMQPYSMAPRVRFQNQGAPSYPSPRDLRYGGGPVTSGPAYRPSQPAAKKPGNWVPIGYEQVDDRFLYNNKYK